jgi:hypothetical protein
MAFSMNKVAALLALLVSLVAMRMHVVYGL